MAPRKIDCGLPTDLQQLVISKMAAAEAANLGATSREMRATAADPLEKLKRDRALDAEAIRMLPEILSRPFRDPAPQRVTHGKYTISTTRPAGPPPVYFYATVASEEMSVEFLLWEADIRFLEPNGRPVVSQNNLIIGGKKRRFVPKFKKYDSIQKEVTHITDCLKLWAYYL